MIYSDATFRTNTTSNELLKTLPVGFSCYSKYIESTKPITVHSKYRILLKFDHKFNDAVDNVESTSQATVSDTQQTIIISAVVNLSALECWQIVADIQFFQTLSNSPLIIMFPSI